MRAYTSLAGHLLGSHPEIDGYYEMHQSYTGADDLARQARLYAAHDAPKPGRRYLFDKLLHNEYVLEPDRLGVAGVMVLIALRPPQPTLKSILGLFAREAADDPYASPAGAAAYYIERVRALAAFAERHPGRFYYYDAELVCSDTARLLAGVGAWLRLGSPLSARYRTFAKTGVARAGDSSAAIASGQVRAQARTYPDLELDANTLRCAEQAYRDGRRLLVGLAADAITLVNDPGSEAPRR